MINIKVNKVRFDLEGDGNAIDIISELICLKNELENNKEICDLWSIASEVESEYQNAKNNTSN